MDRNVEVLIGIAGLAVLALAGFAVWKWRQQKRALEVDRCVREYLTKRDGQLGDDLHIHCTADELWPVLVSFQNRRDGKRHRLQFSCGRSASALLLLSETVEERSGL